MVKYNLLLYQNYSQNTHMYFILQSYFFMQKMEWQEHSCVVDNFLFSLIFLAYLLMQEGKSVPVEILLSQEEGQHTTTSP